uniref:NB-ARC domain-containing protein n=1 Tax=Aegilops tauschii subsp. strangulata TaxID=200361 RepID=A0A453IWZ1_AEGTS
MAEFVVLLGGCERISHRPYDVYLYTENFMFSRHVEKQKLLSFLLEHNSPPGDHAIAVRPIIGGAAIGKKTLVAHVCGDERVRSRFSSILMLVVIEFTSDVGDDDWKKFHSFVIKMGRGSKIIIVSQLKRLARFGSVQPIFLGVMSYDELRCLFKTLVFRSVDPAEHPRLVQIADEFAKLLWNMNGSLVATNSYADVLRRDLDIQFWRCILGKGSRMVRRSLSIYDVHPNTLIHQGHPVDITDFALHPLSMTPYSVNVSIKKELQSVTFGDLITDPSVRTKGDFTLIAWESRIPPYKSFPNFVTSHAQDTHQGSALPGRKRQGEPI